ncbi:MAG: hypothetical protein PQ612_09780 [Rickettsiales bacterium]|nr:hypothetical protein [Pseudomonadota bacterium]MDA0966082.1 hypothetical protein [Pseudomonadota bacterium]MDG4544265.1 hypothetical protein [Rickettsiales bacterium]MDG4546444.1 hypothetical protein [Rickettsiales bacterium]MDG4548590.1 hypothetical protein [Rickettsiales bacterium]
MANDKFCFVLGAGASSHFGYPLGNELVEAMEKLKDIIEQKHSSYNEADFNDALEFLIDIKSYNPLNIDYYLHNHPDKEQIAKKLIEAVILYSQGIEAFEKNGDLAKWWRRGRKYGGENGFSERHNECLEPRFNKNYFPASNWVKFIHHKIVVHCKDTDEIKEELKNISIVTFNYDLSFEQALWRYFQPSKFADIRDYLFNTFFKENIVHVYGKVVQRDDNGNPIDENYECQRFDIEERLALKIFQKSKGNEIKIIGVNKSDEINVDAIKFLKEANYVYFLGYAFDEFNNQTLDLKNSLNNKGLFKNVLYTNYDDGLTCDRKVRSFFSEYDIKPSGSDNRIIKISKVHFLYEQFWGNILKSKRNVYEALERDLYIPITTKK